MWSGLSWKMALSGMLGARVNANMRSRLLEVDEDDLLTAFERRDVPPPNWQGEHVGKFLHAAFSFDPSRQNDHTEHGEARGAAGAG